MQRRTVCGDDAVAPVLTTLTHSLTHSLTHLLTYSLTSRAASVPPAASGASCQSYRLGWVPCSPCRRAVSWKKPKPACVPEGQGGGGGQEAGRLHAGFAFTFATLTSRGQTSTQTSPHTPARAEAGREPDHRLTTPPAYSTRLSYGPRTPPQPPTGHTQGG